MATMENKVLDILSEYLVTDFNAEITTASERLAKALAAILSAKHDGDEALRAALRDAIWQVFDLDDFENIIVPILAKIAEIRTVPEANAPEANAADEIGADISLIRISNEEEASLSSYRAMLRDAKAMLGSEIGNDGENMTLQVEDGNVVFALAGKFRHVMDVGSLWSGDAGSDELQGVVDGIVGSSYHSSEGPALRCIDVGGELKLEYELMYRPNAEVLTVMFPFAQCIGALKRLLEVVKRMERGW